MVSKDMPCLGPVTHAGCGALCPAFHRGCYGCYGPKEHPNTAALAEDMKRKGLSEAEIFRQFHFINSYAEAFREESQHHEQDG
jgi:coenzyme F420-reducing hydrogenase gamma subunit